MRHKISRDIVVVSRRVLSLVTATALQLATVAAWAQPPAQQPYPPPNPYAYPHAPPAAPVLGPTVNIISNNPNATLQQMPPMQVKWRDLCVAPCGGRVDPNGMFRIAGTSVTLSEPFRLPRSSGAVELQVDAGSKTKKWVGFALSMGGIGALALGGLYWSMGNALQEDLNDIDRRYSDTSSRSNDNFLTSTGKLGVVTGIVLLAVGIPIWLANNTTTVTGAR